MTGLRFLNWSWCSPLPCVKVGHEMRWVISTSQFPCKNWYSLPVTVENTMNFNEFQRVLEFCCGGTSIVYKNVQNTYVFSRFVKNMRQVSQNHQFLQWFRHVKTPAFCDVFLRPSNYWFYRWFVIFRLRKIIKITITYSFYNDLCTSKTYCKNAEKKHAYSTEFLHWFRNCDSQSSQLVVNMRASWHLP